MTDRTRRWYDHASLLFRVLRHAVTAFLSRFYARDPDLWVFGAGLGSGFVDNAKYLFLHAEGVPEVRAVWLSKDRETVTALRKAGYDAHRVRSVRGTWLRLRAGVAVVTHGPRDVGTGAIGGATLVNLWHGLPVKTIGFDAELRRAPRVVRWAHRALARRFDALVVPSPMAVHQFHTGLGVSPDRIRVLGYPRHDPLVGAGPDEDPTSDPDVEERLAAAGADGPLVLYLPTFREPGADLADRVDFEAVDRRLDAVGARLLVKPHPFERVSSVDGLDHVSTLEGVDDVYPLLDAFDVLVTDYSSVFLDFLLLDRPVVFYAPDLETYRAERGFYYDYETFVPGPVAVDTDSLLARLTDAIEADPYAARRSALREAFLVDATGSRSATVFEAVRALSGRERDQ
ncbi:CDP-glycerol glycerophosphotransferase family protein [Halomarina litorea]|uniref:CDP-glycerol glycerophosphotransferase family protein n=1 Tax=Halomarina litorea TaxID=2961595 RepID=UPI0020C301BA|nr:CDP-glycerol glycerophosphotransferase family protein [Halomarina sp. BCD28]